MGPISQWRRHSVGLKAVTNKNLSSSISYRDALDLRAIEVVNIG